jgi:hypothetical protein
MAKKVSKKVSKKAVKKPEPVQAPKPKKKRKSYSRASRMAEACQVIRGEIQAIRNIIAGEGTEEEKLVSINDTLNSIDLSSIDELKDEITSWKDNIEEKFSATEKYAMLEECESNMDDGHSAIESAITDACDLQDAEEILTEIESGLDTLEMVEFPGMF